MDKQNWEEKARAAFEAYLPKLKAELPKDADFAMMESAKKLGVGGICR